MVLRKSLIDANADAIGPPERNDQRDHFGIPWRQIRLILHSPHLRNSRLFVLSGKPHSSLFRNAIALFAAAGLVRLGHRYESHIDGRLQEVVKKCGPVLKPHHFHDLSGAGFTAPNGGDEPLDLFGDLFGD